MTWFVAALLSALLFSISNAITKDFQPKLSLFTGLLFLILGGLFAVIIGMVITGSSLVKYMGQTNPKALWEAITSGFVWASATFVFFYVLSKNAPLSLAMPVIVGGIGVGGVLAGLLVFHESLTTMQLIGIIVVLAGSVLLARG